QDNPDASLRELIKRCKIDWFTKEVALSLHQHIEWKLNTRPLTAEEYEELPHCAPFHVDTDEEALLNYGMESELVVENSDHPESQFIGGDLGGNPEPRLFDEVEHSRDRVSPDTGQREPRRRLVELNVKSSS